MGRRAFKAQRGPVRPGYSPLADRGRWATRGPYFYFVYLQLRSEISKTRSIGVLYFKIYLYSIATTYVIYSIYLCIKHIIIYYVDCATTLSV